jgi:UDP-3-O-[3-hydroxymyristoyl] glucosamine N-acyltransferase
MQLTATQLAQKIDAQIIGDESVIISSVAAIDFAHANQITFITDEKHLGKIAQTGAGAVLVSSQIKDANKPQLLVKDVNKSLIDVLEIFAPKLKGFEPGISPKAEIAETAKIGSDVHIGPGVVIDDGVEIGDNAVLKAGCKIGENSRIGKGSIIDYNVVVYHVCYIGKNVIIQANSTIGATGFGYYFIDGAHRLIPHNGGVIIEDFVEIGSNSCVDRAKFGNTIIGAGSKIDDLVMIAHNVIMGKCCLIMSQVGIAGSTKLGDGVVLAGQVGVKDNIEIGSGVIAGAKAGIVSNIEPGMKIVGAPADDAKKTLQQLMAIKKLPEMIKQFRKLSKRVESLEASKDDKIRS